MNKKTRNSYLIIGSITIMIIVSLNVYFGSLMKTYNKKIEDTPIYTSSKEFDFNGEYDILFLSGKLSTENPIIFNDKEYIKIEQTEKAYRSHIEETKEKVWTGIVWKEIEVEEEVWDWEIVKQDIQQVEGKIKFGTFSFDNSILNKLEYNVGKVKGDNSYKKFFGAIENNYDYTVVIKNFENGNFDSINFYYTPKQAKEGQTLEIGLLLVLFDLIILCFASCACAVCYDKYNKS